MLLLFDYFTIQNTPIYRRIEKSNLITICLIKESNVQYQYNIFPFNIGNIFSNIPLQTQGGRILEA
jgi:hypothetical protein